MRYSEQMKCQKAFDGRMLSHADLAKIRSAMLARVFQLPKQMFLTADHGFF
jgi:hypothetical protein